LRPFEALPVAISPKNSTFGTQKILFTQNVDFEQKSIEFVGANKMGGGSG
jgi:hypothetical protein